MNSKKNQNFCRLNWSHRRKICRKRFQQLMPTEETKSTEQNNEEYTMQMINIKTRTHQYLAQNTLSAKSKIIQEQKHEELI